MKRTIALFSAATLLVAGLTSFAGVSAAHAADSTIYVKQSANGDGTTADNALNSLDAALAKASDGDTIEIVGTYVREGGSNLNIDKAVTIQGGNLILRMDADHKVFLTEDTTFKNITLESRPESNSDFRIFANGYRLTFDGVTTVQNTSSNAPTIYTGKVKENLGDGIESRVEFKNSPAKTLLNGIKAGDESLESVSQTPAEIVLDANVGIAQGKEINLGKNAANVHLKSTTANFKRLVATDAPNATVTLTLPGQEIEADFIDLASLFVTHGKVTLGEDSNLTGGVGVLVGAVLDVRKVMERDGGEFRIKGNTGGEGQIHINGGVSAIYFEGDANAMNVVIQNHDAANQPLNEHTYVYYDSGKVVLSAAHQLPNCKYNFESGVATVACTEVKKAVSLSVTAVNTTDPLFVIETTQKDGEVSAAAYFENLLPELQKHPRLVLLTESDGAAPVIENDKAITIEWQAREAGAFKIKDTDGTLSAAMPYTVTTDAVAQQVSYSLPAPPSGKRYKVGMPGEKNILTGDARFVDLVFELELISDPQQPRGNQTDNGNANGNGNDSLPGDASGLGVKPGDTTQPETQNQHATEIKPQGMVQGEAADKRARLADTGASGSNLQLPIAALVLGALLLTARQRYR